MLKKKEKKISQNKKQIENLEQKIQDLLKNKKDEKFMLKKIETQNKKIENLEKQKFENLQPKKKLTIKNLRRSVLDEKLIEFKNEDVKKIKNYFETVTKKVVRENLELTQQIDYLFQKIENFKI